MLRISILLAAAAVASASVSVASAQDVEKRLTDLEQKVQHLRHDVRESTHGGAILVLFGAFCALWAQNTGRNPWLWFVVGAPFSIVAVLVLLWKNARDRTMPAG